MLERRRLHRCLVLGRMTTTATPSSLHLPSLYNMLHHLVDISKMPTRRTTLHHRCPFVFAALIVFPLCPEHDSPTVNEVRDHAIKPLHDKITGANKEQPLPMPEYKPRPTYTPRLYVIPSRSWPSVDAASDYPAVEQTPPTCTGSTS